MRRLWFVVLVVLSLAACSSAPPKYARTSSGSSSGGDNVLRTMPPGSPHFVDHSIGREEISIQAMSLVGIPYRWGGNTPESGFDCSGLVRYVVGRAADVNLPRTTADISRRGESIEPDEIAPGDLVFFNTTGRPHSHVGVYVGKLRFVNAPSTGGTVRLDYLTNPYWARHFDGIRRVAAPLERPSPFDAPTELAAPQIPAAPRGPAEPPVSTESRSAVAGVSGPYGVRDSGARATPVEAAAPSTSSSAPVAANASTAPIVSAAPTASTAPAAVDPIDAAADAFEPPPPVAIQAERQARRAGALALEPSPSPAPNVQILRASTVPRAQRAPSTTADDPIAQFANGAE